MDKIPVCKKSNCVATMRDSLFCAFLHWSALFIYRGIFMSMEKEVHIFCENVKYLRSANNLSKTAMAKKMGVCRKTLESIEQGIVPKKMTCKVLFNIYTNFGIEPPDMITNTLSK